MFPRPRAISVTPTIKYWSPRKSSTPLKTINKPNIRFKPLDLIEESVNSHALGTPTLSPTEQGSPFKDKPPENKFYNHNDFVLPLPPFPPFKRISSSGPSESTSSTTSNVFLMQPHNVLLSRRCLTYAKDNIAHFIPADCEPETPVTRLLVDIIAINLTSLKSEKPKIGKILIT